MLPRSCLVGKQSQNCFVLYGAAKLEVRECDLSVLSMQTILKSSALGQLLPGQLPGKSVTCPKPALTVAGICTSFSLSSFTPGALTLCILSSKRYLHIFKYSL